MAIPGLPGGLIIYQGHLFAPKTHVGENVHFEMEGEATANARNVELGEYFLGVRLRPC